MCGGNTGSYSGNGCSGSGCRRRGIRRLPSRRPWRWRCVRGPFGYTHRRLASCCCSCPLQGILRFAWQPGPGRRGGPVRSSGPRGRHSRVIAQSRQHTAPALYFGGAAEAARCNGCNGCRATARLHHHVLGLFTSSPYLALALSTSPALHDAALSRHVVWAPQVCVPERALWKAKEPCDRDLLRRKRDRLTRACANTSCCQGESQSPRGADVEGGHRRQRPEVRTMDAECSAANGGESLAECGGGEGVRRRRTRRRRAGRGAGCRGGGRIRHKGNGWCGRWHLLIISYRGNGWCGCSCVRGSRPGPARRGGSRRRCLRSSYQWSASSLTRTLARCYDGTPPRPPTPTNP